MSIDDLFAGIFNKIEDNAMAMSFYERSVKK